MKFWFKKKAARVTKREHNDAVVETVNDVSDDVTNNADDNLDSENDNEETYGPYDLNEALAIDPHFLDELHEPAKMSHVGRHSSTDTALNKHVWTKSLALYIPNNARVLEESGSQSDNSNGNKADALHIVVPRQYGRHDEFTVVVVAKYSPTNEQYWSNVDVPELLQRHRMNKTPVALLDTVWGESLYAMAPNQFIYQCGADGPRWSLMMTAFGPRSDANRVNESVAMSIVHDMMNGAVVMRQPGAGCPGYPMDVALVDRRITRDSNNNTADDNRDDDVDDAHVEVNQQHASV